MHDFLNRLGRFCARRGWAVIVAWLIVVAGVAGLRSGFGGEFYNNYTVPGSQSSQGLDVLQKQFPSQGGYAGQIVFHAKKGTISDDSSAVNSAMKNVAALPDVVAATSPLSTSPPRVSKDGTIAYGTVSFSVVPASLGTDYLAKLDTAVKPARSAGLQVEYGAGAGQIGQQTDDKSSEIIGLTCALLLLFFMFMSIWAAVIPLLSALFSVLTGLSLVGLLAAASSFPTTAPTVATLLGLGVAIDYGLFLVARHREHVDQGMDVVDSAADATSTSGGAVVVAGGTVVVAILGLYVSGVPFVGAMGLASAIVVAVAILAALTLTPAFMGVAGTHVRAFARYRNSHPNDEAAHERSAFARWGKMVSNRPWPWAIASFIVLCIFIVPIFSLRLGQLDAGTNPTKDSSRRAYDLVAKGFGPGANGPLTVVVSMPKKNSSQENKSLLTDLQSTLTKTHGVASVTAPQVNKAGTTASMNVVPTTSPQDQATTDLVNRVRDDVLPPVKAETYVAGTTAGYVDFTERTAQRMPWLILAVVALSFILLTVAFRSVVIATKAGVLNLISVGAAYGVMVAVFQWQWGSELIGIHESLPIPAFVPMLMFAIVFGLSMDYEVFLISRVHEAWMKTGDSHRSVAIGIGGTARVITTAAAIMVVVFTSFVLDDDPTVKMLAVGMAVAVLIDASIIRMIFVPAIMSLLDEHAWWMPRWLDRITPHIDIEGTGHTESQPHLAPAPAAPKTPTA